MTTLLYILAQTGLFFSNPTVLACIVLVGFLISENIFGRTLFILLFTMIYNVYLKSIWQMPLPEPLEGWAFPSGHMHSAFVFWGWLGIEFRRVWFSAIVFLILSLVGYGLIYNGFHYPIDIMGSVGFGSLSLLIYAFIQKLPFFHHKPYRLSLILLPSSILCILLLPKNGIKPHIYQALGGVVGFSIGWCLLSHYAQTNFNKVNKARQKVMLILLAFIGSVGFFTLLELLPLPFKLIIFSQFFMIALWINLSKIMVKRFL